MNKTQNLRIELEDLKNQVFKLNEKMSLESKRTDRIVQVLLNTLSVEQLKSKVTFHGNDCCDNRRDWFSGCGYTLQEFLTHIIDP